MRRLTRRDFLIVTGAGATAAAISAACGGDGDDDEPSGAATEPASPGTGSVVTPGADVGAAAIRWYGQAMFTLTTPGGSRLLLDPFNSIGYTVPPPLNATLTTITHEHPDHNNDGLAGTGGRVLRGLTTDGWADIDEEGDDFRVKSVRTFHDDQQGAARGRNAVFVFETAGLRIAHMGDLGHQLDDTQITALGGPVDVLMVPTGGAFTIDPAGATELVNALKPKMVFPMHYKTDKVAFPLATIDPFVEGKVAQRVGSTNMRVSKADLPAETTVFVLDYE
jgi:L-ascorbate metabolism protein UlaG (beta-lactamase superfamily)